MRVTSPFGVNSWVAGDNYAISDRDGFKYKRSEMRKQWDNIIVGKEEYELRNAQDFVKAIPDQITVYDTRSEGVDTFITTPVEPGDL
jgi:hypothetical protein